MRYPDKSSKKAHMVADGCPATDTRARRLWKTINGFGVVARSVPFNDKIEAKNTKLHLFAGDLSLDTLGS